MWNIQVSEPHLLKAKVYLTVLKKRLNQADDLLEKIDFLNSIFESASLYQNESETTAYGVTTSRLESNDKKRTITTEIKKDDSQTIEMDEKIKEFIVKPVNCHVTLYDTHTHTSIDNEF